MTTSMGVRTHGGPVLSGTPSVKFCHKFAEIRSLNRLVLTAKVATNASVHASVSHRDDRFGDQREAAAQARLLPGGGSSSQGDPPRRHGQRAYFIHRGSASSPGACGHKAEPRGATEVLPDHPARNDLDVVSSVGSAEVRQLPTQDRTATQSARYTKACDQDGPRDPELGLHEDPRRTSHGVEDRERTDGGGGRRGRRGNRAGARAGEEANVEAVPEDALGYAVCL